MQVVYIELVSGRIFEKHFVGHEAEENARQYAREVLRNGYTHHTYLEVTTYPPSQIRSTRVENEIEYPRLKCGINL